MPCVPPKSASQNPVSVLPTLAEALVLAGVYEPVEGEMSFNPEIMERIARLRAADPKIPNLRAARELEMSRSTIIRYGRWLEKLRRGGCLDLEPYADEQDEETASGGVSEYDPTESLEMTLRLIQGQKANLAKKMAGNKSVSTQQILQLVDAEKKLLSIPQRAEDVPKDYYDQLDERVPVPEVACPRCGEVLAGGGGEAYGSEEQRCADFGELGSAGDLVGGGEQEGDKSEEAVNA